MSPDLADVQTGIQAALLVALGDPSFDADWDNDDRVRADRCARLQWTNEQPAGRPEVRQSYDPDADEIVTTIRQDSTLTIDVRFESPAGSLATSALAAARQASIGMFLPEALALLPSGLALIAAEVIPIRNFPSDGYIKSGATLSLRFRLGSAASGAPTGWVEQVVAEITVLE